MQNKECIDNYLDYLRRLMFGVWRLGLKAQNGTKSNTESKTVWRLVFGVECSIMNEM